MNRTTVTHGNVETLPTFKKGLKDMRCCDGDSITLECVVAAAVPPEVRWEKGGRLLPLGGDFVADFDGETARLTVNQVYPEDEGEYTCVVFNDLGRSTTSACIVVDVPEEKENLLSRQLTRPPGLMSGCSTPRSTPRTTPSRSVSPYPPRYGYREPSCLKQKRLKVASPKFYAVPHNRIAEEGETVRFQCAVAGHPTPWVTWDKNGTVVTPSARITISEKDDLKVLEITEVTVEDAGLYRVTLENEVGRVEATARLDVIGPHGYKAKVGNVRASSASPRSSPAFRRRLVGSIGRMGGNVTLACDIRSSPNPVTSWYRNGELVVRSERVSPTWDGHTAMLEINSLELDDAGVYTCVAENELGKAHTTAELVVLEAEDDSQVDKMAPVFVEGLADLTADEGTPMELSVRIQGTGPLDVVWVRDNNEIPDCEDFRYVDYGDGRFGLRLADAFAEDSGEYSCEVFNQHGEAITTGRLWVKDCQHRSDTNSCKLSFSKKPTSAVVACGRGVSFCARVQHQEDQRRPVFYWRVAGQLVDATYTPQYTVEEDGDVSILRIRAVKKTDAGQVTCTARYGDEGEGAASCSAELTVLAANSHDNWASEGESDSELEARRRKARSRSLSTSELDVDLPKMLREHPSYSVGKDGELCSQALLVRGPADANVLRGDRVILSATYCGQPEPQVRWLKGGQELKCDGRITIDTTDGMSSLTVEAITADDSGKYVVSVENIHGADCHFASVAVEGPPDPPSGKPTVSRVAPDSVQVAWSSPAFDGGCKVTGYQVEMRTLPEEEWTTVTPSPCHSLSLSIKDLQVDQRCVFRVRAENIHGKSDPSCESEEFVLQPEVVSPEQKIVSIESGDAFKDKYDVLEELGKGRYGVVHKVTELRTGQKFAAKFIRCIKIKDREKVKEEIDIMNCLSHPKLLQLVSAFESPREVVMVMEYISGGELFERVVADDFQLTERDCVLFVRQICEGVEYMHQHHVVHLDLKPENIMCQTRTSHEIKLIDFGLAQKLDPNTPVRVLFGTPEFVPPEIINYEPIGVESDMWSVGVICYVLLSGLSPFMGENDAETFANITRAYYDFDDEAFEAISQDAKDFISALLVKRKEKRLTASECLQDKWMTADDGKTMSVVLSTDKLKKFIIRRKWQKTGNAIRALGRMATLSAASRRNSGASSTSSSPRPSLSVSRMSSVSQDDADGPLSLDACGNNSSRVNSYINNSSSYVKSNMTEKGRAFGKIEEKGEDGGECVVCCETQEHRTRMCSERSDSGISDCSSIVSSASHGSQGSHGSHPGCQCSAIANPLLSKKFSITEDVEFNMYADPDKTEPPVVENKQISTNNNEILGTNIDDIRRKFVRLSQNIDEMDKKLETVSRKLVDIGPGKIANVKKSEMKRVPSLKDTKPRHSLMQPTASSQQKAVSAKQAIPAKPAIHRDGLTIPKSPDLKTSRLSRTRTPPTPLNGSFTKNNADSFSAAKFKKADSLRSQSSIDSGVGGDTPLRTTTAKRADFARLQQMYNSKSQTKKDITEDATKPTGSKNSSVTETDKSSPTSNSLNFQKTVAFWKR